jgi:GNAT superfamily N-acetyltransferase
MPRIRSVLKHITDIDQKEYALLWKMNLERNGSMQARLEDCQSIGAGWAITHYDSTGAVDGWSLLFQDHDYEYVDDEDQWVVYFYVPPENRRRGIATRLLEHTRLICPDPFVVPWSDDSGAFFKTCKTIKVSRWKIGSYGLDSETVVGV